MSIESEVQNLSPSAIIDLYQLDLTSLGDTVYYFHNGTNGVTSDVVWQGQAYTPFPIETDGYEVTAQGEVPRPRIRVSNILGVISTLMSSFDDLIGAKFTRKRTFLKYLDAVNFTGGVNPDADPTVEFVDEVYFIDRKVAENPEFVEFELTSPWDVQGVKLPNRQIIQNTCPWVYRGAECGYAGGDVADINNNEVGDPAYNGTDACAKNVRACELRFGENATLPFGGFPGAGKLR